MNGGDTFRLVGVADRHTWVILSDPHQDSHHVLIVSFTSFVAGTGMDVSCLVEPHEFAVLTNRSCLYYQDIREASVSALQTLKNTGRLQTRTPMSQPLLQRIRDGAIASDECKEKHKQRLRDQNLVA